jgi:hypothetical protein
MAEAPSLPYARDEASTSYANATYQQYADTFDAEEEDEMDGEMSVVEDESTRETQYWAANRHRGAKADTKGEEEQGGQTALRKHERWLMRCSGMETTVKTQDIQLRHVHLSEYRCRPSGCRQNESVCKARVLAGSHRTTSDESYRCYRTE